MPEVDFASGSFTTPRTPQRFNTTFSDLYIDSEDESEDSIVDGSEFVFLVTWITHQALRCNDLFFFFFFFFFFFLFIFLTHSSTSPSNALNLLVSCSMRLVTGSENVSLSAVGDGGGGKRTQSHQLCCLHFHLQNLCIDH